MPGKQLPEALLRQMNELMSEWPNRLLDPDMFRQAIELQKRVQELAGEHEIYQKAYKEFFDAFMKELGGK